MEPDRLRKDELEYELSLRGVINLTGVQDMRKKLKPILSIEGKTKISHERLTSLDPNSELKIC